MLSTAVVISTLMINLYFVFLIDFRLFKSNLMRERERERDRQTDRHRDTKIQTEREIDR